MTQQVLPADDKVINAVIDELALQLYKYKLMSFMYDTPYTRQYRTILNLCQTANTQLEKYNLTFHFLEYSEPDGPKISIVYKNTFRVLAIRIAIDSQDYGPEELRELLTWSNTDLRKFMRKDVEVRYPSGKYWLHGRYSFYWPNIYQEIIQKVIEEKSE